MSITDKSYISSFNKINIGITDKTLVRRTRLTFVVRKCLIIVKLT